MKNHLVLASIIGILVGFNLFLPQEVGAAVLISRWLHSSPMSEMTERISQKKPELSEKQAEVKKNINEIKEEIHDTAEQVVSRGRTIVQEIQEHHQADTNQPGDTSDDNEDSQGNDDTNTGDTGNENTSDASSFTYNEADALMEQGAYTMDEVFYYYPQASIITTHAGSWSDPTVWKDAKTGGARMPATGDIVEIRHNITYDQGESPTLAVVNILTGKLSFSMEKNTSLSAGYVYISPYAELSIGSQASPLPAQFTAQVKFLDPSTLGNLLAAHGYTLQKFAPGLVNLGNLSVYAAEIPNRFAQLTTGVRAGATVLSLSAPLSSDSGRELIVPDTELVAYGNQGGKTEKALVASVNGNTLTLAAPLANDHLGHAEYPPYVADISSNIIFRDGGASLQLSGGRDSRTHISYARFENLSREGKGTDAALHLHMLQNFGQNVELVGNAIVSPSQKGVVIHSTSYALLKNNVVYNAYGAAFYAYMADEYKNVFERNGVFSMRGTGERPFFGDDRSGGDGFWFRGPGNIVRNNVVTGGCPRSAYAYNMQEVPHQPIPDENGTFTTMNLQQMPITEFSGNEVHGPCQIGLEVWYLLSQPEAPSVIKNFTGSNIFNFVFPYDSSSVIYDGLKGRGAGGGSGEWGWIGWDYPQTHVVIKNADLRGFSAGIIPSTITKDGFYVYDSYLENQTDLGTGTPWYNNPNNVEAIIPPRTVIVENTVFAGSNWHITRSFRANTPENPCFCDYPEQDYLFVLNYNNTGESYQVFYKEYVEGVQVPPPCTEEMDKVYGYVCDTSKDYAYSTVK